MTSPPADRARSKAHWLEWSNTHSPVAVCVPGAKMMFSAWRPTATCKFGNAGFSSMNVCQLVTRRNGMSGPATLAGMPKSGSAPYVTVSDGAAFRLMIMFDTPNMPGMVL